MFNFEDILRGYSSEQYSEALVETLVQLLVSKDLISNGETKEYYKNNFNEILQLIIKRDREESKKKYEEYNAEQKSLVKFYNDKESK